METARVQVVRLGPFRCPSCDHELIVQKIGRPDDDGTQTVDKVLDLTAPPTTLHEQRRRDAERWAIEQLASIHGDDLADLIRERITALAHEASQP